MCQKTAKVRTHIITEYVSKAIDNQDTYYYRLWLLIQFLFVDTYAVTHIMLFDTYSVC
jgi:hypothetical protein